MKKTGKRKPHWLDGDQQRIQSDIYREMLPSHPEHVTVKVADVLQIMRMDDAASSPERVLEHGILCVRSIKERLGNLHSRLDPAFREKLRASFIEKGGLSAKEADWECDAVEVRGRPTLRCLRDAWNWLCKAGYALNSGRDLLAEARTAKDEDAHKAALIQAEQKFARAVSLAYYAGIKCGELQPRTVFDEKIGSYERPKRKDRLGGVYTLAVEARKRWLGRHGHEQRKPTDGEIYLEIQRDNQNVRKQGATFEFRTKTQGWKPLCCLSGFRSRMSEWRKRKYPDIG